MLQCATIDVTKNIGKKQINKQISKNRRNVRRKSLKFASKLMQYTGNARFFDGIDDDERNGGCGGFKAILLQ